jgi:hypothetical protein
LGFFRHCFIRPQRRNNSPGDETILSFWRRTPETPHGYQAHNNSGRTASAAETGDSQMRTFSFILAFAFVLVGPSMAGSLDGSLPGVGTFAYNGSAIVIASSPALVVAAR